MRRGAVVLSMALFGCAAAQPRATFPLSLPPIPPLPPPALPTAAVASIAPAAAPVPSVVDAQSDAAEEADDVAYENGGIDDDEPEGRSVDPSDPSATAPTDPRLSLSDSDIRSRAKNDLASLGSLSLGVPSAGGLVNAVQLKSGPHVRVVDPGATWGTEETINYLSRVIDKVYQRFPDAPPLSVGHISSRRGGPLSPHRSHQSGRDVDIGYYYKADDGIWYKRATSDNLDTARTWELVRALLTDTDVEYIFINLSVQKLLKEHAAANGEDARWLDTVFQYGNKSASAIVRHVHGHDTHLHVRFFNPIAEELGRRALPYLAERKLVERREQEGFVPYRIHNGETLHVLAKRFNTTVEAIQKANRLRGLRVVAGRTYLVPQKIVVERARVLKSAPRTAIPRRRLPPNR